MKSEKLINGFIVSYVINCIFFLIAMLLTIFIVTFVGSSFDVILIAVLFGFVVLINFVISSCILIVTTVLGIKNYKKSTLSNTKKTIIIMLSVLGGLHVLMLVFWVCVSLILTYGGV